MKMVHYSDDLCSCEGRISHWSLFGVLSSAVLYGNRELFEVKDSGYLMSYHLGQWDTEPGLKSSFS